MREKVQREFGKCAQHFYGVTSRVLSGCESEGPATMGEVGVLISTDAEEVDESKMLEEDDARSGSTGVI